MKCRNAISPVDHPAGLAVHRPVSGEAAGGNHCSCYQGLQHSPADPQLHQGQHRGQGKPVASERAMASHVASDEATMMTHRLMVSPPLHLQAMKVVGVKAHTEQDRRQVMLDLYLR